MTEKDMWTYNATVGRVVDADTIDVVVDLGFGTLSKQRLRISRIDAWETRGEEKVQGLKAKARVQELMPVGSPCVIETKRDKKGKYGRYLAEVTFSADGLGEVNLSDLLVEEGHAEYKEY